MWTAPYWIERDKGLLVLANQRVKIGSRQAPFRSKCDEPQ